jgi:chemotaxis protein methyltransferase CheR
MAEPERLEPTEVTWFRDLIRARSGLYFPPSRQADLEYVISQTLASTGLPDFAALHALFANGRGEAILEAMIADLTVGETYFFRNQPQFHALERHILPELIARRRSTRHLRLWSAGCASGEEPYSLAILLERLLPDLADWNVHILATDLNPKVLARAREGRYGPWSFRHVPPEIKDAYFKPCGQDFEIVPRLRERVTFTRLNLVEDVFPSYLTQTCEVDLILCRNVLIYFKAETVSRVVDRLYAAMAEGGWLIVGHAEPSQLHFGRFNAHNFPGTVVYRKEPVSETVEWGLNSQWASPLAGDVPSADGVSGPPSASPEIPRPRTPAARAAPPANPQAAQESAYMTAKRLADRGEWAEAERSIAAAIDKEPLSAPAHHLHAMILLERGTTDAALAALRRCVFADSGFVLGHLAMADVFARQGQAERARKALETAGRLAASWPSHEAIPEGDGLTAGRVLELVNMRKQQ